MGFRRDIKRIAYPGITTCTQVRSSRLPSRDTKQAAMEDKHATDRQRTNGHGEQTPYTCFMHRWRLRACAGVRKRTLINTPRTNPRAGFRRPQLPRRSHDDPLSPADVVTVSHERCLHLRFGRDVDSNKRSRHRHIPTRLRAPTLDKSNELPLAIFIVRRGPCT